MSEENKSFQYTYSSKRQDELRRIREKYITEEEDKMEHIRRLDASVTKPGMTAAVTVGIIGILLLGIGMCCSLVWADTMFIPGIILGVIGIAGISSSYPLYSRITKRQRKKLAPEILRLTDELMK